MSWLESKNSSPEIGDRVIVVYGGPNYSYDIGVFQEAEFYQEGYGDYWIRNNDYYIWWSGVEYWMPAPKILKNKKEND